MHRKDMIILTQLKENFMLRTAILVLLFSTNLQCSSKSSERKDPEPQEPFTSDQTPGNPGSPGNPGNPGSPSTPGTATPDESCYDANQEICALEQLMIQWLNDYRKSKGLSALAANAKISYVARIWSKSMLNSHSLSHEGFPKQRQAKFKERFPQSKALYLNRENVGMMYGSRGSNEDSLKVIFQNWQQSSGHNANMLAKNITLIGIGVSFANGEYYATQIFGTE
jgi:uncharacterized protein YkwD